MENLLKKIGFVLLTLVLTIGIYWLVFVDKATRQDALEYSLNLLGKKLLAMVPDTADKQPVQMLYDQFVKQAKYQEISPERIERVAANIMNLSNIDTAITPQQAEAILRWSLAEPLRATASDESTVVILDQPIAPEAIVVVPPPPPRPRPEELKKTGERIKALYMFNLAMQKAMEDKQQRTGDRRLHVMYHVDDGLKIVIDPKFKFQFSSPENKQLHLTMQRLEKEKQLIWQENWQQELERQKEQYQRHLEKLKELQQLQQLDRFQQLESLKSLEALKNLDVLTSLPAILIDSAHIGGQTHLDNLPDDSSATKK